MRQNGLTNNDTQTRQAIRPIFIADKNYMNQNGETLRHIISGLSTESVNTCLVCPDYEIAEPLITPNCETIVHPTYRLPFFGKINYNILLEKAAAFEPTILHCLSASKAKFTARIAAKLNLPYVLSLDNLHHLPSVNSKHCANVIPCCDSVASMLKDVFRYPEKIKQVNCASFVEADCACFNHMKNITSLLIVTPLVNPASLLPVLSAVRHLTIEGYEFVLIIIGKGRAEHKIRRHIQALGLSHVVNIIPPLKPLRSIFSQADIFIQPYSTDYFNAELLEAMSVGMAVAASTGGVDDLIIKNKTAAVFDPEDELSIYATLQQMLDKKEWTKQLAKDSQKNIKENHSVAVMTQKLLDIYRKAQQWYQ